MPFIRNCSHQGTCEPWNPSTWNLTDHEHSFTNRTIFSSQFFDSFNPIDIFSVTLISFSFIIAVLGNGLLVWTIWKKDGVRGSADSQFLLHLSAVNFGASVLIFPLHIVNKATNHHLGHWFVTPNRERRCLIPNFLLEFFLRLSWDLVALIAFSRYMALIHTVRYHKKMSRNVTSTLLGGAWIYAFVVPVAGKLWRENDYFKSHYLCAVKQDGYFLFLLVEFIFSFFLPLMVFLICWGKVFLLSVKKRLGVRLGTIAPVASQTEKRDKNGSSSASDDNGGSSLRRNSSSGSIGSWYSSLGKSRKTSSTVYIYNTSFRALRTVAIIVGSFFLTNGLYVTTTLLEAWSNTFANEDSWIRAVGFNSVFLNSAFYPLVYGLLNRELRTNLRSVLRSLLKLQSSSSVVPTSGPRRRWSISSHVLDYLPNLPSSRSGSNSRRTSIDSNAVGGNQKHICGSTCRGSCLAEVTSNSSSIFQNFFSSKAARRRVSAPPRLQHNKTESGTSGNDFKVDR